MFRQGWLPKKCPAENMQSSPARKDQRRTLFRGHGNGSGAWKITNNSAVLVPTKRTSRSTTNAAKTRRTPKSTCISVSSSTRLLFHSDERSDEKSDWLGLLRGPSSAHSAIQDFRLPESHPHLKTRRPREKQTIRILGLSGASIIRRHEEGCSRRLPARLSGCLRSPHYHRGWARNQDPGGSGA